MDPSKDVHNVIPASGPFVARCILHGLREGNVPSAGEANALHTAAILDEVRRLVEPSDIEWILDAAFASDDDRAGLLISLVAFHSQQIEVQTRLQTMWDSASTYIKCVLLWRLLDSPSLTDDWHRTLFAFIKDEWGSFQSHSRRFFGGTEELLIAMSLERYYSKTTVETKRWAYLCTAAGSSKYPAAAGSLLKEASLSSHAFTREVAEEMTHRALHP